MTPSSLSLQASALSFVALSIGHTIGGKQWTAEPTFRHIAGTKPWACGVIGWYQVLTTTQQETKDLVRDTNDAILREAPFFS
ncbi:hypothetical protein ABOM_008921 [Aspergillus bombycis]|uniref:Uncharacterized protein n=1 Tax=Aspergillus bombycis TaxID=109264 RepID=A0A1F7ZPW4_9EURO|nr:hypothetical protein ABOM_008921 [Aspergillus bombycis]OGM41500.1 hypothetical protein ABOM_008921 [Aspergillus bombycis]